MRVVAVVFILVAIINIDITNARGRCIGAKAKYNGIENCGRFISEKGCWGKQKNGKQTVGTNRKKSIECQWDPSYCAPRMAGGLALALQTGGKTDTKQTSTKNKANCEAFDKLKCDQNKKDCMWRKLPIEKPGAKPRPLQKRKKVDYYEKYKLGDTKPYDKTPYNKLAAVDKKNIKKPKQGVPKKDDVYNIGLKEFEGFEKKGWKVKNKPWRDGLYDFVVLNDAPDTMRLLFKGTAKSATGIMSKTGHTSLVSVEEYKKLQNPKGKLNVVFAGEIYLEKGKMVWWSARSGHFLPVQEMYKVFGNHWGFNLGKFHDLNKRLNEMSEAARMNMINDYQGYLDDDDEDDDEEVLDEYNGGFSDYGGYYSDYEDNRHLFYSDDRIDGYQKGYYSVPESMGIIIPMIMFTFILVISGVLCILCGIFGFFFGQIMVKKGMVE